MRRERIASAPSASRRRHRQHAVRIPARPGVRPSRSGRNGRHSDGDRGRAGSARVLVPSRPGGRGLGPRPRGVCLRAVDLDRDCGKSKAYPCRSRRAYRHGRIALRPPGCSAVLREGGCSHRCPVAAGLRDENADSRPVATHADQPTPARSMSAPIEVDRLGLTKCSPSAGPCRATMRNTEPTWRISWLATNSHARPSNASAIDDGHEQAGERQPGEIQPHR